MDLDWSVREDLLAAAHRWYEIVAFCLAGALLGALVSYLWPTPYRASRELYVGLNVYQAGQDRSAAQAAGLVFLNANDYKNWQMSSLNSVVFMDVVIDDTLARLQAINPYWTIVGREELARMLHVYWRNAGKWRLVAEHSLPDRAVEAVLVWQDVLVEHVHAAVGQANQALVLDTQLNSLAQMRAQGQDTLATLEQGQAALHTWQTDLNSRPADQPLASGDHDRLQQTLVPLQAAGLLPERLQEMPPAGVLARQHAAWISQVLAALNQSLSAAREHQASLDAEYALLSAQFAEASQKSLGLSPELLVQKLSRTRVYRAPGRPVGSTIRVGAGLGWIAWALWGLYGTARQARAGQA